jgi:hypothetical protein
VGGRVHLCKSVTIETRRRFRFHSLFRSRGQIPPSKLHSKTIPGAADVVEN